MKKSCSYIYLKLHAWILALLVAGLLAACGGGTEEGGTGTLGISLTDAPACGFDAVYVTVSKVRVHQQNLTSGWADITLNPTRKINLLDLNNGALENLGETSLPSGRYSQLRLVLDNRLPTDNSVILTGTTTEIPLDTPSAAQSGIKLNAEFDVIADQRIDLVMDFNACKSIVKHGNGSYGLKPVIKLVPTALNGIRGFVDTGLLGSDVLVTAQQNGEVVKSTAPKPSGEFYLTRLPLGDYDVVLTADGHATAVVSAVPITTITSEILISNSGAPLALQVTASSNTVSGTATLNPVSATEVAYVSAKQTLGAAPIITVRSVAADDMTGTYTMTLPVDAPWLGQYSASLPIVLAAQVGVVGTYTLEASASGYQASSPFNVDVSTGNAVQDFTLTP